MGQHARAAEIVKRLNAEMPVFVTLTDPFTGKPYTLSKENLLRDLTLDSTQLTLEGQIAPLLHAEMSRAARACEYEEAKAEMLYRKWKAQIAQQLRAGTEKQTEKSIEEAYRLKPEYDEMCMAPKFWAMLHGLFADLKESLRIKSDIIKAHERSLDASVQTQPSENIDRLEDLAKKAIEGSDQSWRERIPRGPAVPPPEVLAAPTETGKASKTRKPRRAAEEE